MRISKIACHSAIKVCGLLSSIMSALLAPRLTREGQFEGYTEVSRCQSDGNSWGCAGAAGQGLGGVDCCKTNLTTSLEPYPFSTINKPAQPGTTTTSALSEATPTTSTSDITTLTSSSFSLGSTSSTTAPTSSASPQPTAQNHNAQTGIEVGVPVAVVTVVLLAILAFFVFQNRKQKQRLIQLQNERAGDATTC